MSTSRTRVMLTESRTWTPTFSDENLHRPSFPVYGYAASVSSPPLYLMYSKAWEGNPPLQPLLLKAPAQSTSCCSDKEIPFPNACA